MLTYSRRIVFLLVTMIFFALALMTLSSELLAKDRSFVFSLPIVQMNGEVVAKGEYNISGRGGVGIEAVLVEDQNLYNPDEAKEHHNDSIFVRGEEVGVYYSSYGNPKMLSGGYWTLGAGYRQVRAEWKRTPDDEFTLTDGMARDENGRVTHTMKSSGATGRARIGYRYVGESFPIALGAYIGIRHFQNQFADREEEASVATPQHDLESLQMRLQTALEPGIEFGMSF